MSAVTESVREVALLVEREPRSIVAVKLREVALLASLVDPSRVAVVREVAELNDYLSIENTPIHDTALLFTHVYPTVVTKRTIHEIAKLATRTSTFRVATETVREVALLLTHADAPVGQDVREVVLGKSRAYGNVTYNRTVREVAILRSRALPDTLDVIRETASLGDTVTPRIFGRPALRERNSGFAETLTAVLRQTPVVRERANLRSATAISGLRTVAAVRETAYLYDAIVLPPNGKAWTCSIITWGMSRLANFPFLTMAGNLAAGSNLWRLDGAKDNGDEIESYVLTGILELGTPSTKRLRAVYVSGSADAPLTLTVTGDVEGKAQESHTYDLDLRDTSKYRANRTLVGRGFRSKFLQFKIGSAKSVPYRLLQAEVDVDETTRRLA